MTAAAVLALVGSGLLAVTAVFQLALSLGAPWAAVAYGGRAIGPGGRLPALHRIGSAGTALLLVAIGLLLLVAGGVLPSTDALSGFLTVAVWIAAALFAVNTLGNLAARHPVERWGMGGITAALTAICVLLALAS